MSLILPIMAVLLLSAAEPSFDAAAARRHLDSMRPDARAAMSVDPVDGEYFYKVTLDLKAKNVLEVGTSTGYSGGWFALALRQTGGKLITLEIDEERHNAAISNFKAMNVADLVEARLCNALEELEKVNGPIDIVFIDAWKPDYLKYYELVIGKVRPGGVILAHNVKNNARAMSPFLEKIKTDPRVRTEFLEESLQGLSISWKK